MSSYKYIFQIKNDLGIFGIINIGCQTIKVLNIEILVGANQFRLNCWKQVRNKVVNETKNEGKQWILLVM